MTPHDSTRSDDERSWGPDPIDRSDMSLADRFDLFHRSHPVQFCRRDRAAMMAALVAIAPGADIRR